MLNFEFEESDKLYTQPIQELILVLSKEGNIINLAENARRILGNIENRDIRTVISPTNVEVWDELWASKLADGEYKNGRIKLVTSTGAIVPYRATIKFSNQRYILSLINIDIELHLEKLLEHSLSRFMAVVEDTHTAICITNSNGLFEYVNKGYCNVYGYKKEELIGNHFSLVVPEENKQLLINLHDDFFENKTEIDGEWQVVSKLGEKKTILASATYIIGEDECPKKVTFIMDITERKEAEKKLATYAIELEKKSIQLNEAFEKTKADIEKAKQLHQQFLPKKLNLSEKISISAYYEPAEQLGGDYYNLIKLSDDHLGIYFSDVSGHGLDGAMLTIYLKNTIDIFVSALAKTELDLNTLPKMIIENIASKYIEDGFGGDYFICLCFAVLDLRTFKLTYASAGFQVPMLLCDENGVVEEIELGDLPISTAISKELYSIENKTIYIKGNSSIIFLTDGIIEEERQGQMFGINRLKTILQSNAEKAPSSIKESINKGFKKFMKDEKARDDITFIIVKRIG